MQSNKEELKKEKEEKEKKEGEGRGIWVVTFSKDLTPLLMV
ncbi:MAG: hypothetical protein QXM92_02405 [Candidatus Anstonellales archaeon]